MGTRARTCRGLTGAALAIGLTLTGCSPSTGHPGTPPTTHSTGTTGGTGSTGGTGGTTQLQGDIESAAVPLQRYASCDEALATLRLAQHAATAHSKATGGVAPPGTITAPLAPGQERDQSAAPNAGAEDSAPKAAAPATGATAPGGADPTQSPDHSTTNTAEAGVDEPDTVKTDGKLIVSVAQGTVYVVGTSDKRIMGSVVLPASLYPNSSPGANDDSPPSSPRAYYPGTDGSDQLLLSGDRVLAISRVAYGGIERYYGEGDSYAPSSPALGSGPQTRFTLIDISDPAHPKVVSTLRQDGDFVDARMMGTTVRAVTRTNPIVPQTGSGTDWLPHYELQSHLAGAGGAQSVSDGTVDCAAVSHPDVYSGTSLVSLETFDLGAPAGRYSLGTGNPVSVVADGETVYATGSSLYIANDLHAWQSVPLIRPGLPVLGSATATTPADPYRLPISRTEIYKFDVSGTGAPRPVASGSVPGWLLNQYSLSEYQGNLRIATTDGAYQDHADATSSSAVYVLAPHGDTLARIGAVTGLGQGEKIYSVRFAGPVGYVVTFRQMDPLFVVDLRDPAHPKAAGQVELTGYSSYLHPVDDKTLIGLGQASTASGRRLGTQVSLFDVSDPSAPRLAARYELPDAYSSAEGDPHAFLYWKPTGMLVVPVSQGSEAFAGSANGALVLRVGDGRITEEGFVKHAGRTGGATFGSIPGVEQITRSLVANDTLWTVSGAGLLASNGLTLEDMGWIPYP
ncbi:beta-propeller domain-containing protein [Catenulispora subtropica]|uniref:Beta-propeller domain-containing protein n=1 Tax=Catenulispora subtropica TaxID=450798 RepID=A0ABP5D367_9ACTN